MVDAIIMKFDNTRFGSITIDGKRYKHDVYLLKDGTLKKRDKSHSPRIKCHRSLSIWELEQVLKDDPKVLLIGMGQSGVLPMSEETKTWLEEKKKKDGLKIIKANTPDILEKTNALLASEEKFAGIYHTTC
ncbi:MAG: hypothetical protein GF383_07470 [Candidatus Lokiarchaeota archaeon]|nr:hypothetical protein [Candidatus Lokiarchaeota archaeon]MBD3340028.1 hypothetical protein [Candidatus Lokiarchaeota archaeon]